MEAPSGRVQMTDVARLAGVSTATVSRALSGNTIIPEQTRQRIAEVARSIGYRIHQSAANLRKGHTNSIGVVVLVSDEQPISDPFVLGLIGHIADALNERGMNLLLTRIREDHKATMEAMVTTGQVAGLLVIGQNMHHQRFNELHAAGVPLVVWGAKLPDTQYSVVGSNNQQGGYLATRHLIQGGAKRIMFLGDHKFPEGKLRYSGYLKALKEAGIKPDKDLLQYSPLAAKDIEATLVKAMEQGIAFDGVFATSDVGAIRVIATLGARNIKVPEQVKVVGYDNIQLSEYVHPSVTTINQPIDQAAVVMVELLKERMAGTADRSVELPAELIARQSTR